MNANATKEKFAAATGETAHEIIPETRQEKAILTGNYAGSVEAILMDMEIREALEKIRENLDSAHALNQAQETRGHAVAAYNAASVTIHKLEKIQLTEQEKARLSELTFRFVGLGLEFAVPGEGAHVEHVECPA